MYTFKNVGIESVVSVVPSRTIDNQFFSDLMNEKEIKIFEKTVKIKERRWAEEWVTSSDLALKAAIHLIDNTNLNVDDIGCVLFLSQTSDYKIPFTSNIIQAKLGLSKETLCLDINAGCAGFIQGLYTAFSISKSLKGKKTLFLISETLSKILNISDRSTSMLFGDGASALLISNNDLFPQSYFNVFSDGVNFDAIIIPEGGYRNALKAGDVVSNGINLQMDGQRVFDFTLREIAPSIKDLVNQANLTLEDINYYLLHQSNSFIIDQIAAKLKLSNTRFLKNIGRFGNTSGVSIPLLLSDSADLVTNSDYVLLSGYGSGLNWGNTILNLRNTKIFPIIEFNE